LLVLVALGLAFAVAPTASADVAAGKALYGRYCVACHGANGIGVPNPTPVGPGPLRDQTTVLEGQGPPLQDVGALSADFYLRTGYMPLRKATDQPRRHRVLFGESQLESLIAYVATLGKGPPVPRPHPERGNVADGLHEFIQHCAGCHQVVGEGGYVTGAVAPRLGDATATQIAEAVRVGPYLMPSFSQKAIPDEELDSIIAYVEQAKHPNDRGGWALGHLGPVPEGLVTWFLAGAVLIATCMLLARRLR
jgi:ubiquinol-cytochrome c reductase cytochrome c subunit